ncbi:MAG TPA: class I SAM-dependent methyltransferase family protein [Streptosporangiaceae bacterium]
MTDWADWHAPYDDPGSSLSARLREVQALLRQALDRAPAGPVRLVSLCAGQGRDVIGVLAGHPRRDEVSAVLVEYDPRNAQTARERAAQAGLARLEVRQADAARAESFADALPADVLLLCGIFGNISDRDIEQTIAAAPGLCAAGATVLWTRHRRPPDLTSSIRRWFRAAGFEELAYRPIDGSSLTAGAARLPAAGPVRLPGQPLFAFGPG